MRHLLSAICRSVILGSIATLAIAGVCPTVFQFTESQAVFVVDKPSGWPPEQYILIRRATAPGAEQLAFISTATITTWRDQPAEHRETPPDLPAWATWPDPQDLPDYCTDLYVASGWPFKCAVASRREFDLRRWAKSNLGLRAPPVLGEAESTWHCAMVLDDQPSGGPFSSVVIPFGFRPIETVANIATIAGGLLTLSLMCWVTKYFQRRLRSRCPACGYNLRGRLASGCPECGWHRPGLEAPQPTECVA